MKRIFIFILLILFSFLALPGERITLPEPRNPEKIFVDGDRIYITEFPTVYIYSLKDFKLIKKFGSSGEGPREFKEQLHLTIQPDYLLVQSIGKVLRYTRDGDYINEFKIPYAYIRVCKAFGNQLVLGKGATDVETKTYFLTVNLCGHDFNNLREVYRMKHYFQDGKPMNAIYLGRGFLRRRMSPLFYTYGDKIFIEAEHGETGTIEVFNAEGKKQLSIKHDYQLLELTDAHKKEIEDFFIAVRSGAYRLFKQRGLLAYPGYFPPIRIFHVADGKVYVVPYKKEEGKSRMIIFSMEGKFLKKVLVDLAEENIFEFYPYAVSGGKIYQLVENEETEVWELVIRKL